MFRKNVSFLFNFTIVFFDRTRHLGRSATFGCRQLGCTFITKSSKHLCEHIKKHRIVMSGNLMYNNQLGKASKHENINLAAYLVDDDIGIF